MPPFVVLSLPRSRSFWLSQFLSYQDWHCGHDQIRYARTLEDVRAWLSMPETGTCETAGAPFWRLLTKYAPDCKIVTIRRPVSEVVESLRNIGGYDGPEIEKIMAAFDRKLDQIEGRVPRVLSVKFDDLAKEESCAKIFEHCLPYKHDHERWRRMNGGNLQINYPALVRYVQANLPALKTLAGQAQRAMLTDLASRPADLKSVEITSDSFDVFIRDCAPIIRQHCFEIGEHPDNWLNKNLPLMSKIYDHGAMQIMVGRSNGRAFGYLMTIIAPSLETRNTISAQHAAFYASPDMPGLGLKLQRASLAALKERGVSETFMRAGIRGNGDRMGSLYKRLGGQDFGQMYRVSLEN